MRNRLQKRRKRADKKDAARPSPMGFPWNEASRMAVLAGMPKTGRPARYIWRIVHGSTWPKVPRSSVTEKRLPCYVCGAPVSKYCICGATFAKKTKKAALGGFARFVRHRNTPCIRADDPQDQSDFATLLVRIAKETRRLRRRARILRLLRAAWVCATLGSPESASELASVAARSGEAFEEKLAERTRRGLPVFRGGQCPGNNVQGLAPALKSFSQHIAPKLAKAVDKCRRAAGSATRADAFRTIIKTISESKNRCVAIKKFKSKAGKKVKRKVAVATLGGAYRRKRLCEMLVLLLVHCRAAGLYLKRVETNACAGVWPISAGSMLGIRAIWPGLRGQDRGREALRVLQRALKPGDVDIIAISALLCFGQRTRRGSIAWGRT